MEAFVQERKGILGGLSVPMTLHGLLFAILALLIFKLGVFGLETLFEEPFLLERATVKVFHAVGVPEAGVYLVNRFRQPVFSGRPWLRSEKEKRHLEEYAKKLVEEDPEIQKELDKLATSRLSEWEKKNPKASKEQKVAKLKEFKELAALEKQKEIVESYFYYHRQGKPVKDKKGNLIPNDIVSLYVYKTGKPADRILEIRSFIFAVLALFTLLIWSFFTTAISRCVAIRLARDDYVTWKELALFGLKNFRATFLGALIPAVVIGIFFACNIFAGWVLGWAVKIGNAIPVLGVVLSLIPSLLFFLVLLASMIITLVAIPLFFGSHLIPSTIATEVTDAFDGFFRSLRYTYSRPWEVLLATGLMGFFLFCYFSFVAFFHYITYTAVGLGWGDGFEFVLRRIYGEPTFAHATAELVTQYVILGWMFLAKLFILGYAIYYIPAAYTTLYFMLRKDVDGDSYSQIYIEEEVEDYLKLTEVTPGEKQEPATAEKSEASVAEPQKEEKAEEKTKEKEPPVEEEASPSEPKQEEEKVEEKPEEKAEETSSEESPTEPKEEKKTEETVTEGSSEDTSTEEAKEEKASDEEKTSETAKEEAPSSEDSSSSSEETKEEEKKEKGEEPKPSEEKKEDEEKKDKE